MAYTTASITRLGSRDYLVTIEGTNIGAGTEVTIPGLPRKGRIRRLKANKSAGTATTLNSLLGTTTNPTGNAVVLKTTTPAAPNNLEPTGGTTYYSANGTLYYRGQPDAGSDNTESVEIFISDGWEP